MLQTGTCLGPYEIRSLLGAGGMGEVYLARDTRLGRTVALKILPSADPLLKARFSREAQAISALTHPNICALYDVGEQGGTDYLVMEYLEGQTLEERLRRGPMPFDELLARGIEIADALDTSHRAGLVHRDLKPSNIMLTKSGAKLLDFGVAKLRSDMRHVQSDQDPTESGSMLITRSGVVVGTPQYMAPEVLEGKEADARSDLFALGAVLFEMATGRRACSAVRHTALVDEISSAEPSFEGLRARTPHGFAHLVKTCLVKDPNKRRQSVHDVKLQLEWLASPQSKSAEPLVQRGWSRWAWFAVAIVCVALAGWAAGLLTAGDSRRPEVRHVSLLAPGPMTGSAVPEVSPDGRKIALTARGPTGATALWIRSLESSSPTMIAGTDNAYDPFWSANSRSVGFFAAGKLKTVDIDATPPLVQTIADATDGRGATWNRDGDIVFAKALDDGLYRVRASGGEVTGVTTLDRSRHNSHRWPQFFPDGRHLIYLARSANAEQQGIYVGTIGSSDWKLLIHTPLSARVATAPQGVFDRGSARLLFIRDLVLMAQPIDLDRLELTGAPTPIADSVGTAQNQGLFSVGGGAALAYRTTAEAEDVIRPLWFDRLGKVQGGVSSLTGSAARVSRDSKQVAMTRIDRESGAGDIWLEDDVRGPTRLTTDPAYDWIPVWAPDAMRVAFSSNRTGNMDLYEKHVSGSEPERLLWSSDKLKVATDWSRDGELLFFQQSDPVNGWDIWALRMGDRKQAFPLLDSKFNELHAVLSPDGKWLAYASDETGTMQVYVRGLTRETAAVKLSAEKRLISIKGGNQPRWRAEGKELFYLSGNREIVAVPVKPGPVFATDPASALFSAPTLNPNNPSPVFDVSADGKRFLIAAMSGELKPTVINLFLNWTRSLKD